MHKAYVNIYGAEYNVSSITLASSQVLGYTTEDHRGDLL
jgi:hypothetical protein